MVLTTLINPADIQIVQLEESIKEQKKCESNTKSLIQD